jgi:hypothetical protein
MTAPLRRLHRNLWLLLAVLLPLILAMAIEARRDTAIVNRHLDWRAQP